MKTAARHTLLAFLLGTTATGVLFAAGAGPAAGRITVIFSHPEKFTDVKEGYTDAGNERGRERYFPLLQKHIEREAGHLLPAGQKLTVTFTDVDLAGDFEPWHGAQFDEVRIMKDIYIPRLKLTFRLTDANDQVIREGERELVDLAYQMRLTRGFRDDPLRYEKDMLTDWLAKEFTARKD